MGCNESENVNFSERSYEANMSMYMCYEMRRKSANKIGRSKNSIKI